MTVVPAKTTARPWWCLPLKRCILGFSAYEHCLAVTVDDEQRIVDADTKADHRRERRPEGCNVDEVRRQRHQRDSGAQTDEGGKDGSPAATIDPNMMSMITIATRDADALSRGWFRTGEINDLPTRRQQSVPLC